jgi:membrane-associated progesterone receptor component
VIRREELKEFNGSDPDKPIWLGCNGNVFDVSSSDSYKEGASYHLFAGQDASVALGRMSFKDEDLYNWDYSCLSVDGKEGLENWH